MDLDLTEYDQVDEIKSLMMDNPPGEMCSKFIVTMSSCSDQTSIDEANCENDFVFLPGPPPIATSSCNQSTMNLNQQKAPDATHQQQVTRSQTSAIDKGGQQLARPLVSLKTSCGNGISGGGVGGSAIATSGSAIATSGNPFSPAPDSLTPALHYHYQAPTLASATSLQKHQATGSPDKPLGLLVPSAAIINSNPNKLAELMQQIVIRSDLICIEIPCSYCIEPIACPPSDISSWLNHMSKQHNCKLCPVCNRLVGLGPFRDVEVMRRHVIEHLDSEWLEQPAARYNFTFGLQKQWFSGSRCSVKR